MQRQAKRANCQLPLTVGRKPEPSAGTEKGERDTELEAGAAELKSCYLFGNTPGHQTQSCAQSSCPMKIQESTPPTPRLREGYRKYTVHKRVHTHMCTHIHTQIQRYMGHRNIRGPLEHAWAHVATYTSLALVPSLCQVPEYCEDGSVVGMDTFHMGPGLTLISNKSAGALPPWAKQLSMCGGMARVLPACPCHLPNKARVVVGVESTMGFHPLQAGL